MKSALHSIDNNILHTVQKLPDWLRPLMLTLTFIGEPLVLLTVLFVFSVYMFVTKQTVLAKVGIISAVLLLISPVLKIFFQRNRPEVVFASITQPKSYSFPSGHAYMSMLVLGLLTYLAATRLSQPWSLLVIIVLATIIFGIGISRIYLGVHYASDVIAGWALGAVVLIIVIKLSGI